MHGLVTGQDPRNRQGDLELKLENPLGFFESERLVHINESLLQALGCQWDRPPLLPAIWDRPPLLDTLQQQRSSLAPYALDHTWVDKDPRLCITYPAYLHILLRRIPLVVSLREPLAVATSLHARNGFSLNRGLVLWWVYNHHIASQLCPTDLLITYSALLSLDDQTLNNLLGPFLERHMYERPSNNEALTLVSSLLKPEFNRADDALNAEIRGRVHPILLNFSQFTYKSIIDSGDCLSSFKEHFNCLPRVVLECSMREKFLPEADLLSLKNRLHSVESQRHDIGLLLQESQRDCALLRDQLSALQKSRSWKITAPLRSLANIFWSKVR